ncbi:uncharacterized protein J8A68_000823 [[Candida] subhashii]|uniref:SIR4-interacting protein SIF2 n=1 Tax=[Candida] subhashii TaxID=561895 RepID=A0A8J5QVQ4_9ASCO|nr:uncharacterized protein J8A68_000823 [[Candida] subhashii]KAG7665617.1 hypothetical protein J8A68_000823 [[Candida] subhashii]
MSLTSKELNYMVWRYLQESGHDLAAYALDQQSHVSSNDDNNNIITNIKPGCLVNLIQKGILYSVAQLQAGNTITTELDNDNESKLSLLNALISDDLFKYTQQEQDTTNDKRFLLKSEVATLNGNKPEQSDDIEMEDAEHTAEGEENIEFETSILQPIIKFSSNLTSDWHPSSTNVFAYGKSDGNAIINAFKDNKITETVTLNHPNLLNLRNDINIVSWSPQGNSIITAGTNNELRVWSPDGKLKNIATISLSESTADDDIPASSTLITTTNNNIITSLYWSPPSGKFLITIHNDNHVSLWDGNTLSLIKQIKTTDPDTTTPPPIETTTTTTTMSNPITACWLAESKFAITTHQNTIKIYDITPSPTATTVGISQFEIQPIGLLPGHNHIISIMKLNPITKLLASCSDFDYLIKVWNSGSISDCIDLNIPAGTAGDDDVKLHSSPIVGLDWIGAPGKDGEDGRNILVSVSMDGILNIWDVDNHHNTNLKSSELFKNHENFKYVDTDESRKGKEDALVFNAVMAPNGRYLALGDDYCRITIWDISLDRITKAGESKSLIRCLGIYEPDLTDLEKGQEQDKNVNVGICDLKWDYESKYVTGSYNDIESVIVSLDEKNVN